MSNSQRVLLVNTNDDSTSGSILFYVNGATSALNGGQMREIVKLYTFQYPQQSSTVLGAGIFLGAMFDNDW